MLANIDPERKDPLLQLLQKDLLLVPVPPAGKRDMTGETGNLETPSHTPDPEPPLKCFNSHMPNLSYRLRSSITREELRVSPQGPLPFPHLLMCQE